MKAMILRGAIPIFMCMAILAGCLSGPTENKHSTEDLSVRIMYHDERSFHQEYGMVFMATHPKIEVEVVPTTSLRNQPGEDYQTLLEAFIEEQKPDIMMINLASFDKYASEGKLLGLDSFISKDKYNLDGMLPGVVEYFREKGQGELYGLTPDFYSRAIFYNKDLFDRYNIPYPEDKMSWEELLHLAARFPTDGSDGERVYGLRTGYQANLYQLGNMIGATNGLSFVNPDTMQMMINTNSWKNVFATTLQALKSGTLYFDDPMSMSGPIAYEDFLFRDPFISGKIAMTLEGTYLMNQIKEASNYNKERAVANWDLVTMPVNPENPDYSSAVSFSNIFAIDVHSPNQEAAWKFIKYIHSEEYARVKSKTGSGNFPIRTKYIQSEDGKNFEAFYALKPAMEVLSTDYSKLPQEFAMQYMGIATQELEAAMNDTISIDEALDNLQNKAQEILMQFSQNEQK